MLLGFGIVETIMLTLSTTQLDSLNKSHLNNAKQQLCRQLKEDLYSLVGAEILASFESIFDFFWQEAERYKVAAQADQIRFLAVLIPLNVDYLADENNHWLENILNTDAPISERIDTIYRLIKAAD